MVTRSLIGPVRSYDAAGRAVFEDRTVTPRPDLRDSIRRLDDEIRRADSYTARVYRASLLMATGEAEKALADLQKALAMKPAAWRPLFVKAEALRRLGRTQDADAVLAEARALPRSSDGFEQELPALQRRIADPLGAGDAGAQEGPNRPPSTGRDIEPGPARRAPRRRPQPGGDTSPGRNGT